MNLKQKIKNKVGNKRYPTLKRIKVGRALSAVAALPLGTSPLFLVSVPMSSRVSPTLYVKDKLRQLKEWRKLR